MKWLGGVGAWCASVVAVGLLSSPMQAQTVRNLRIDIHPVGNQVGMVTKVMGNTAWVKLPSRVAETATIEFMPFSDGSDVLARGRVQWVSPVAPYEAFVTNIEATTTSHPLNEIDDAFAIARSARARRNYGSRPESDSFGSYLSAGFYARTKPEPPRDNADTIEPVRAYIASLRTRGNRVAGAISAAAAAALTKDPLSKESAEELPVNFSALADNLRRFKRLRIEDPITERVLQRLFDYIEYHGTISEAVPSDFLRPADDVKNGTLSTQGGTR